MRVLSFLFLLFLCSFNRIDYNDLMLGTPAPKVVQKYGDPYSVRDLGNSALEYQYIERISMNNELVYENHYFLTFVNNQLTNKRFREETRQPFDKMYRPDPNYPWYP